jgi:molybdopterin molybdotransferase
MAGEMISFSEAIEWIRTAAGPMGTERIGLDEAAGRVLAEPVVARIDSPRSDVSTRDGYAVRDADLGTLPVRLRVLSGHGADSRFEKALDVGQGECARILTGAPIPPGADRVIMQECVRREDGTIVVESPPERERWIRPFASDFAQGDTLVAALEELGPRTIVAAAAADIDSVEVYRQPRVHIICTGDELVPAGAARLRDGAMPETASLGVAALARRWGAQDASRTLLRDDLPAIEAAAAAAIERADIVITIGGASVGDKDFARSAFEPIGLELLFSKIAMKPGKPAWLGRAQGKLILGLPGNPTSAMVTARILMAPLLVAMSGRPVELALAWRSVELGTPLPACAGRETFHRACLREGRAHVLGNQDSGAQGALRDADLLVKQPADSPALEAGKKIDALDF